MQQSITQDYFNIDDIGPWSNENEHYKDIFLEFNQQQKPLISNKEQKNKYQTAKTSCTKLNKHNANTIFNEFPIKYIRNRIKSMDQPQKQLLKATPVKQFCDFKLSKELLIYRNTIDFPKYNPPKNFLSFQRLKKSHERKKTINQYEINPQLLQMQIQMKKVKQIILQQKKYSWEIGARRLSNPKFQTFLNTLK